jgi:hypothetical protein
VQPPQFQPHAVHGRPPGAGECQLCASAPAAKITIGALTGLVLAYEVRTFRGWFCRSCGLAVYRQQTARTLKTGWWSLTGLGVVPFFLAFNLIWWAKITRLAPPRPSAGVAAPHARPVDPGKPLYRRPVTLMLLLAAPAVLVGVSCVVFGILG